MPVKERIGRFKLFVISRFSNLVSSGSSLLDASKGELVIQHWQARQIQIEVDPPQPVQVDGEMVADTPVRARVLPGALKVIVPKPAS